MRVDWGPLETTVSARPGGPGNSEGKGCPHRALSPLPLPSSLATRPQGGGQSPEQLLPRHTLSTFSSPQLQVPLTRLLGAAGP